MTLLNWLRDKTKSVTEPPSSRPARSIKVLHTSRHYVLIAPPDSTTPLDEVLDEMEFIRDAGLRPLFPLRGAFMHPDAQGWICEKLIATNDDMGGF